MEILIRRVFEGETSGWGWEVDTDQGFFAGRSPSEAQALSDAVAVVAPSLMEAEREKARAEGAAAESAAAIKWATRNQGKLSWELISGLMDGLHRDPKEVQGE